MSVWWLIWTGSQPFLMVWLFQNRVLHSLFWVKTPPSVLGFCKVPPLRDRAWRTHWAMCVRHWHLSCGTRTTRLNWQAGRFPLAPTAPRSRPAPDPGPRRGTPATGWTTRNPNWAAETCSAPSCASSGSWGACRTCRSRALCNCRACRWCGRGSAFSCRCCWRSVCRSRQTHI